MQDFEGAGLRVYTDSSWGRLNGFETVNGDITFLTNRAGQSCVLDWQSLKMAIPAASPLAGEAEAALSGISKVPWLRSLASDMGIPHLKATLVTDSKSLCETEYQSLKESLSWVDMFSFSPSPVSISV